MCNNKNRKNFEIKVQIKEFILTPTACASIINDILKHLMYEKSQIPYPYNWLKNVVTRRRKSMDSGDATKLELSVSRHYNIVSTTFDILEDIMRNVTALFTMLKESINEVLVSFGVTPHSPKELYRFVFTKLDLKHNDMYHADDNLRNKHKILGNIFFSDDWMKAMELKYSTTNMYLLINTNELITNDQNSFFVPLRNYDINERSCTTIIRLEYEEQVGQACCSNFNVYGDDNFKQFNKSEADNSLSSENSYWYQAKIISKGFKDLKIGAGSASNLF